MSNPTDSVLKREILNEYQKTPNVQKLAKKYSINCSTIYKWINQEKPIINWEVCWYCEKPSKQVLVDYNGHKVHKECLKSIENLAKYPRSNILPKMPAQIVNKSKDNNILEERI